MNPGKTHPPFDAGDEIPSLIATLVETERRLEELTAREGDTVAGRDGKTFLSRRSPDNLRLREAARQIAILDALPANIALLDAHGLIVSVNEAWRRFARTNLFQSPGYGVGTNYLEICESARGANASKAHQVASGIRAVLTGEAGSFSVEYPCHAPKEQRWFQLTVSPLNDAYQHGVVVMHVNITERKLAEVAATRLAAVVEFSEDAIIGKNLQSIVTSWNKGAEKIFGYTAAEMVGTSILKLNPTGRPDEHHHIVEKIKRGENVGHFETLRQTKGGTLIHISVTASPIKDEGGAVIGISIVARDITQRQRAEAALHFSEARYRTMLHGITAGVVVHGANLEIIAFNPKVTELLGVDEGQLRARSVPNPIWNRVRADGSPISDEELPYRRAHATRQPVRDVVLGLKRPTSGDFVWLLVNANPVLTPEGELSEVIVTLLDVTARIEAEQAVQRQQTELRVLFDLMPALIWFKDTENRILRVNQRVAEAVGLPVPAIEGRPSREIYPEDAAKYFADDLEVIRAGVPRLGITGSFRDLHGREIWVQTDKVPVRDKTGNVTGIVVVARDITERKRADETLRESEERFRLLAAELEMQKMRLLEAQAVAKVGSWETDAATLGVTWSEETYRIFEADPRSFSPTHERFLAFVHPDDRAEVDEAFRGSLDRASTFKLEHRILLPDGRIKYLEERWRTVFGESGKLIRVSGTCRDFTERKRTEETLRLLSSAVEHAQESIMVTDANLDLPGPRIIFVNAAYTKMTGYTAEESIGKTPRILQGPRTEKSVLRRLRQNLERGEEFSGVAINYRKDGSEFDLAWQIAPMRDEKGKTTHFVAIQQDVSERRRAEDALRTSEKRFKALFEQAAVGVSLADATTGRLVHVNQRFCEIVGRPREEVERLTFPEITHPLDVGRDREMLRQLKEGVIREYTREKRYLRPDHSAVWVSLTVSAMWATGEPPDLCVAVVQDISGRKQLEEQFRQAQKMEAIGTLAGGIAHDFNNVLAAINGYTELAKMELEGNETVLEYLDAVLHGARRATDL
ncbi:MAG: PAS domain S-box protein, partial [Opitutaceae bacterium]